MMPEPPKDNDQLIYIPNALNLPNVPLNPIPPEKYIRQIHKGETNNDLWYINFNVLMIDGRTPALDEVGGQPEINMLNTGWSSVNIGLLETVGYGRYRALLSGDVRNNIGVIVSRYIGQNTFECFGESIEVIDNYRVIDIFEDSCSPLTSSYLNINEAENYFSMRLHSDPWTDATIQDKIKSLLMATQAIDNLAFSGWKTDPNQPREFPRNGYLTIPKEIKSAQAEVAITYLNGYDEQLEMDSLGVNHEAFYSVRTTFIESFAKEAKLAGIPSQVAWRLLKPFLRDPRKIKIVRSF